MTHAKIATRLPRAQPRPGHVVLEDWDMYVHMHVCMYVNMYVCTYFHSFIKGERLGSFQSDPCVLSAT